MIWEDDDYVSFDLETSGTLPEYSLQPWRLRTGDAWITSIAWVYRQYGEIKSGGVVDPDPLFVGCFLQWCLDSGRTLVGWNVVFDIQWLYALGLGAKVQDLKFVDGMLMWRHLEIEPEYETTRPSKKSYSLKTAVREHLPQFAGYENDIDFHSNDPADRERLHAYNIQDCLFTLRLTKKFYSKLTPRQQQAMWIEAQCLAMIAQANVDGMLIDVTWAQCLHQTCVDTAAIKLAMLAPHGVTEVIVRSPIKLAALIYDQWGLPVTKVNKSPKTGKTSRSTDKEVLHELAFIDPRAKELRSYREALNNDAKFAVRPMESAAYCADEGRSHPSARIFGTYSGRLTYSSKQGKNKDERPTGFALHQMPRTSEKQPLDFRSSIIAPEGYTIVEFDAAGQEFRWMALASGDKSMIALCQPGEDAHSYMGSRIFGIDYARFLAELKAKVPGRKDGRQLGKIANLCCIAYTPVLTDRGHVAIQDVRRDDLVWDGIEFVAHDGVVFSGVREVITHDGVTATPEHKVLVDGRWVELRIAKRDNQAIERATRYTGSAVWIVGGVIERHYREGWRAICASALRLWCGARGHLSFYEDGQIDAMQGLRDASPTQSEGPFRPSRPPKSDAYKAYRSMASAMRERARQIVSQLWRPGDRIQICFNQTRTRLYSDELTPSYLQRNGDRQDRQRWPLRAGQPSAGHTQAEFAEQAWREHSYVEGGIDPDAKLGRKSLLADLYDALCGARAFWRSYPAPRPRSRSGETQRLAQDCSEAPVYDIVNCGPRSRFAANGRIVHNSLQYRTSAKKLRVVARTQYDIDMNLSQAERIHELYQTAYPGVPAYWVRQIIETSKRGWVETFAGRRVQVVGDWNGSKSWSMASTAINYRIQGTGADQKYLALMMIRDYLNDVGAKFFLDLHDGIYLLVPDAKAEVVAAHLKEELDNLPYGATWNYMPPIPLPWDCKMGRTWGTLKDWKP